MNITTENRCIKDGACGFHSWDLKIRNVEIGYDLREEFWGNGYMQEALKEIIEFTKIRMNIKAIIACIYINNLKSVNLVTRLGFVKITCTKELFRGPETS